MYMYTYTCEHRHEKTRQHCDYAAREDWSESDQSIFDICMKKGWVHYYPFSAQRRLWSDSADVQSELSLRPAHTFCCFCQAISSVGKPDQYYM